MPDKGTGPEADNDLASMAAASCRTIDAQRRPSDRADGGSYPALKGERMDGTIGADQLLRLLAWHERTWLATLDLQQGFACADEYRDSPLGQATRVALAAALPPENAALYEDRRLREAHRALARIVATILEEEDPDAPGRPWLVDRVLEIAQTGLDAAAPPAARP